MRGRVVLVALACAIAGLPLGGAPVADAAGSKPCAGRVASPAEGVTVISVQGMRFRGEGREKTPARLIAVGPEGGIRWVHRLGREHRIRWSYDVDPLSGGRLFGVATRPGKTVFYTVDARTGEWLWSEVANFTDTHDADLLDRHRILVANMRNFDDERNVSRNRILLYNRTTGEVVWEWRFAGRYPRSAGDNYTADWTHVNDVDRIAPGRYLVSPRNFDQVIVVDRRSGKIDLRVGSDDDYDVMKEQHNPQYLESRDGDPTVLVADSGNDRIVEYERAGGEWRRTWRVEGNLRWPRDADRLPNGNTLVVDSVNDRVLEVTPGGEVVWEVYAPWLVYDAERVGLGDEAGGPTIADQGATGTYDLTHGSARSAANLSACARRVRTFENPDRVAWPTVASPSPDASPESRRTPTRTPVSSTGTSSSGTSPDATATTGQPGFGALGAMLALALALLVGFARLRSEDWG